MNRLECIDLFDLCASLEDASVDMILWYNYIKSHRNMSSIRWHGKQKRIANMNDYITKTCPVCNIEYQADTKRLKHGRQTTCSRKCSYELRASKLKVEKVEFTCIACKKTLLKVPSLATHLYCSRKCYGASRNARTLVDIHCPVCNKLFRPHDATQKRCSRKCFEIDHKHRMAGASNPSYIDGRSINKNYDVGSNWHEIRLQVYKRDNYTCQECGKKCLAKNNVTKETSHLIIQCHHILSYKKGGTNSQENLITLCIRCHRGIHNREQNA